MTADKVIRAVLIVYPIRKDFLFTSSAIRVSLMDSVDNVLSNKIVPPIPSVNDDVVVVNSVGIEFCESNSGDELIVVLVQVAGFFKLFVERIGIHFEYETMSHE